MSISTYANIHGVGYQEVWGTRKRVRLQATRGLQPVKIEDSQLCLQAVVAAHEIFNEAFLQTCLFFHFRCFGGQNIHVRWSFFLQIFPFVKHLHCGAQLVFQNQSQTDVRLDAPQNILKQVQVNGVSLMIFGPVYSLTLCCMWTWEYFLKTYTQHRRRTYGLGHVLSDRKQSGDWYPLPCVTSSGSAMYQRDRVL